MTAVRTASILVLYPRPTDPDAFVEYYTQHHLPKVDNLPGLLSYEYSTAISNPDGSDADHFAFFVGDFANTDTLAEALASPEGAAVAGDVSNFATGGAAVATATVVRLDSPNERTAHAYLDAWNRHDVDGIVACFGPGGRYSDPGLGDSELPAAELPSFLTQLFALVPDLRLDILTLGATGVGEVSAFWRGRGGADEAHPEGRLDFLGADLMRFDTQGRIEWTAALYDASTFRRQLGFVPA
jgi:uncharacterized protein (TIGR02118 family)